MTSVDTNVVIRFLTHDDEEQFKRAYQVFKKQKVFIPLTVLLETEWVLRYAYQFKPDEIRTAFVKLIGLPNVRVANPDLLALAIEWHGNGLEFADALHLAASQEFKSFLTFDKKLIQKAKNLSPCRVQSP